MYLYTCIVFSFMLPFPLIFEHFNVTNTSEHIQSTHFQLKGLKIFRCAVSSEFFSEKQSIFITSNLILRAAVGQVDCLQQSGFSKEGSVISLSLIAFS